MELFKGNVSVVLDPVQLPHHVLVVVDNLGSQVSPADAVLKGGVDDALLDDAGLVYHTSGNFNMNPNLWNVIYFKLNTKQKLAEERSPQHSGFHTACGACRKGRAPESPQQRH